MELTRVNTRELAAAVEEANRHLLAAHALLEPYLVALNEAERASMLKPSIRFPEAGRDMVRVADIAPGLAETAEFDPAAVTEDLDNVALLAPLSQMVERLRVLLDDSKLAWLAEAFMPSLAMYRMSKEGQKTNPKVGPIVTPLADVFASRRKRRETLG